MVAPTNNGIYHSLILISMNIISTVFHGMLKNTEDDF